MNFLTKLFSKKAPAFERPVETPDAQSQNGLKEELTLRARDFGLAFVDEYISKGGTEWSSTVKLSDIETWQRIKAQPLGVKAEICLWACSSGLIANRYGLKIQHPVYKLATAELKLGSTLLRSKLLFDEGQLSTMIKWCAARRNLEWENPIVSVLSTTERILDHKRPSPSLEKALKTLLKKCKKEMNYSSTATLRKIRARVDILLDPELLDVSFKIPRGALAFRLEKDLAEFPEDERDNWLTLLEYASRAKGSKPSQKWLTQGKPFIETVGTETFQNTLLHWMQDIRLDPERPDPGLDVLKGLVWLTANHPNNEIVPSVARFAEHAYTKVAGVGAKSKKIGNACCVALMSMQENQTAIAELVRLRGKIKYPSVRGDIQKKLEAIAAKQNVSLAELEDASLPDFGFDIDGHYAQILGEFVATVKLTDNKAELFWADKAGKARKTIPAAVKSDFKSELASLKRLKKDMSAMLAGQIKALEQSYTEDRSWVFSAWQAQYWEHPIRCQVVKSMIWYITDGAKSFSVLPTDKGLEDASGKIQKPSQNASVKLWHPLYENTSAILAWREKIESRELTQPFKQAHREIYVVTDAELQTEVYSNRFAAHILRQHQFNALCQARDWRYTLQGMWDSWNVPEKTLSAHGIVAEFSVEMVEGDEQTGAGIPLYIATDQVRFRTVERERMNIEDVPAIVFSEIMRDVDLFAGVTSVANDPNWTDGGPDGRFGAYWQNYSFGDLGETAKTRRDLLAKLVPKLAISDKLEVGEKFLRVQGKRFAYKIHFGSGNIMILPRNRYLCIVKAPNPKKQEKVYLPFAGDNLVTIILSKAMMLVNDDKITDRTILSQLR